MNGANGRGRKNRKDPSGWIRIYRIIPTGTPMNTTFLCNSERNLNEKKVSL
jgi:hypothetical protein